MQLNTSHLMPKALTERRYFSQPWCRRLRLCGLSSSYPPVDPVDASYLIV